MSDQAQPATVGTGALLQRDYWARLTGCRLSPSELITQVKLHFCELPPSSMVVFAAPHGLSEGATLDIRIKPGQQCRVQVIHEDAHSLTLGTLSGHPEAGRITFGSYRNPNGDVIFHIRSRARSASSPTLIGFLAIGEAMQTTTWTDFVSNTAALAGAHVHDVIHAETQQVDELPEDGEGPHTPTFLAVGD